MPLRYRHRLESIRHRSLAAARAPRNACKWLAMLICLLLICVAPVHVAPVHAQDAVSSGFAPQSVVPQEPPRIDGIVHAFGDGDARALVRHSSHRLDVTIFGMSELFSRSQAGFVFRDFFAEYRPERFDVTETSGSMGNWFAAGHYWYARGDAPLSVYFRLRFGEGEWELKEVRISRTTDR